MKPRPLTAAEKKSIAALKRLAKTWPDTLTLASMGGSLVIVCTDDEDFQGGWDPMLRNEGVLANIDGIPNTGGDW